MTEILTPDTEQAAVATPFQPKDAFRSVLFSIFINGVLPFAVYKLLVPYFPHGSILPLLCASVFPVIGLGVSLARTRTVDAIAIFAIFGLSWSIVSTLLAGEVHLALIWGTLQGFVIAAAFVGSALIGRPIMFYLVRQFMAGSDPVQREHFAALDKADGGRTFFIATMGWGVGILAQTGVSLVIAMTLEPATVLLLNNVVNTVANIAMLAWSIRFIRGRLTKVGEQMAARAA
jgi:hypothetical protein